ncbi:MAG: thiolase family protein [Burkholderiales bacterium]|nr:thiolase family protein [Burkholderiales bacterium]
MRPARLAYDGVAAAAPVTVPYARYSERSAHHFAAQALRRLLDEADLEKAQVDGIIVSSFGLAPDTVVGLTQQLGLVPRWMDHIPTGGASGVMALRRAARAVQCGDAQIVACIGADTNHVASHRLSLSNFSQFARDATYPYGAGGPNTMFALITDNYMRRFGATPEDFGRIAVSQRANASRNANALLRRPITLEDYLRARPIADPLRLLDCVMPCAGAEAFLVMREERARDLDLPHACLRGAIERHNAFTEDPVMVRGGWLMDQRELYAQAGITAGEIDVLHTYDDYPVIVMMQLEGLGFCDAGEAPAYVRAHTLTHDGSAPHNTSGGQLSAGQAGAAGGYLGVTETLRQLTQTATGRQVPEAHWGLTSGFGIVNYDRCVCTGAVVLESAT